MISREILTIQMSDSLDPNSISIDSLSKSFEYERLSRELDECDNVDQLRETAKCFLKLYMKTTEALRGL